MTVRSEEPETATAAEVEDDLTADQVREYLLGHADFFSDHPDILRALTPEERFQEKGVVDLNQFMVDRLRDDVGRLQGTQGDIIDASRANLRAQSEVHEAILAILSADSFERMIATITSDIADILRIDVVSICVEAANNDPIGQVGRAAVYVLPPGAITRIIGEEDSFKLQVGSPSDRAVFGPASGIVKSFALARMDISVKTPVGLLALGSRDEEKFAGGQGTELLRFLVNVIEQQFRAWLALPK